MVRSLVCLMVFAAAMASAVGQALAAAERGGSWTSVLYGDAGVVGAAIMLPAAMALVGYLVVRVVAMIGTRLIAAALSLGTFVMLGALAWRLL